MALSDTSILSAIELAIYSILLPITLFVGYRHGRKAILGYIYLNMCCVVRIATDIIQLVDNSGSSSDVAPSVASLILSSIGLSPLILAAAGFLHELHKYHNDTTLLPAHIKSANRWVSFGQLQIHAICTAGMVMIIIGAIDLGTATTKVEDMTADRLRSAGIIVLVFLWFALLQYGIWLLKKSYRYRSQQVHNQELTIWTLIGLVFIGIKLIYATVYLFDRKDSAISPIYGNLAVKVVLVVGVQLLAVIALTIGGYRSLNIAQIPLPDISGQVGFANLSGGQLARPKQTKRGLHHARVTVMERV